MVNMRISLQLPRKSLDFYIFSKKLKISFCTIFDIMNQFFSNSFKGGQNIFPSETPNEKPKMLTFSISFNSQNENMNPDEKMSD